MRLRYSVLILLIIFMVFMTGCGCDNRVEKWKDTEKKADMAFSDKNYKQAVEEYRIAYSQAPDNEKSRIYSKLYEAEFQYKSKLAMEHINAERYTDGFLVAKDYLTIRDYEKALAIFKLFEKYKPDYDNGIVYFSSSKAYESMGRYDEALLKWEEGRTVVWDIYSDKRKAQYLQLKAELLIHKNQNEEAIKVLEQANKYDKLPKNYFLLGLTKYNLGNVQAARKDLFSAIEKRGTYPEAENLLLKIIPYSEFTPELLKKAGLDWDAEKVLRAGIDKFNQGEFELSHHDFEVSLLKDPQSEIVFLNWANEQRTGLKKRLEKDKTLKEPEKTRVQLRLANLNHYVIGSGQEAKDLYLKILNKDNKNFEAYLNYGIIIQKERKFEVAFENLKKAVKLKPDSGRANFFLGLNFLKIGNLEGGYPYIKRSIEISSDYKAECYQELLYQEFVNFVPFEKADIEIMKKFREFFTSPNSNKFEDLIKSKDNF